MNHFPYTRIRHENVGRGLLCVSVIIGSALRLYHLGTQSLWGDEALTVLSYTSGDSLSDLLSHIWQNAFHPPLYFAIVHYWYLLGDSEFMLRLPSAFFGVGAIPLVYILARRFFHDTVAGFSSLIMAVSPFHVWYSQEARMYSLLVLLALASMLFFDRTRTTRRASDFVLYVVFTALCLYTHMAALLLVAAQSAIVLSNLVTNWRRSLPWIGVQALILMAFVPWMINFAVANRSASGVAPIGSEREDSPLHLGYSLFTFAVGYSLGPSVSTLHALSPGEAISSHLPAIVISASVFGVLIGVGAVMAFRLNRPAFQTLIAYISVPFFLSAVSMLVPGISLNPRYLIVAIIPFYVLLALGVMACMRVAILRSIPPAAAAILGLSLYNYYFLPAYAKQDIRSAAALVNTRARPGDVVIISSIELGGPFIYYLERHDLPYHGYPRRGGPVDSASISKDLSGLLAGKKRVWLILGRTWSSDPHGLLPSFFRRNYDLAAYREFSGVSVSCYNLVR